MPLTAQSETPRFVTVFDETYNQPDARAYYRMLWQLGYRNHANAVPVFRAVLAEITRLRGLTAPHVFDFASSYGIVTALMKHEISAEDFLERYSDRALDGFEASGMIAADRCWLDGKPRRTPAARFSALDVAENAVTYGTATGLFEQGFVEDLQSNDPSPALTRCLADVDLIVECGSVAHLIPRALDRILHAAKKRPWIVTSPVRGNERAETFAVMRAHGLVVEDLGLPPFEHRRFKTADERASAIAIAQAAGHDTSDFEETDAFFARVYLARPRDEALPLSGSGVVSPL